ncbi:MAG: DUF2079 domain-containing protein [Burkholderiales bacterium]|nr:DUF2079 domain-containing protein [Burkholderiales bacterium]
MSKLFPAQMDRLLRDFLGLSLVVAIVGLGLLAISNHKIGKGLEASEVVGLVSVSCVLLFSHFFSVGSRFVGILRFLDRYTLPVLVAWMVAYLTWCGLVLFANPYGYEVNGGDAAWYVQTLWNLVHGFRPENSLWTLNGPSIVGDDPRFPSAYGYVSIFTFHQYWLPMAMLAPIYALSPQPPMHLFAVQIWVIALGLPGVYWAVRQYGGSRHFALLAAIGYSLLPQVATLLFFKGYMDAIALGILPWLFGAYFSRKWALMYVFALLTALIGFPFTHFVIIFGLAVLIFLRALVPGAVVVLIGLSIMTIDMIIMTTALGFYYASPEKVPSFFTAFVLKHSITSAITNIKFNVMYVAFLLQGMAFLPVIALWRGARRDNSILGLWFILSLAFVAMMWRSFGWEFQRNSFFIVPVFMLGITSCLSLQRQLEEDQQPATAGVLCAPAVLLIFGMASMIFFGNPYSKGPIATHFPWGKEVTLASKDETIKWRMALERLNELVPKNAQIASRTSPKIYAFLANRQHSWEIGREPAGVKYYVFIGDPDLDADGPEKAAAWKSDRAKLKGDTRFQVLLDENPGKPLLILENLQAHPISRNEKLLGWSVVLEPASRLWRKITQK